MRLKPVLTALLLAPTLSACVVIDAGEGGAVDLDLRSKPAAEPVHAVAFTREGVAVRVNSNGCTKKEDFEARVDRGGLRPTLKLVREVEDRCRALLPDGVDLRWTYEELGLDPRQDVAVGNPFVQGA